MRMQTVISVCRSSIVQVPVLLCNKASIVSKWINVARLVKLSVGKVAVCVGVCMCGREYMCVCICEGSWRTIYIKCAYKCKMPRLWFMLGAERNIPAREEEAGKHTHTHTLTKWRDWNACEWQLGEILLHMYKCTKCIAYPMNTYMYMCVCM